MPIESRTASSSTAGAPDALDDHRRRDLAGAEAGDAHAAAELARRLVQALLDLGGGTSACTRTRDSGSSVTVAVTSDMATVTIQTRRAAAIRGLAGLRPARPPRAGDRRLGELLARWRFAHDARPAPRRLTGGRLRALRPFCRPSPGRSADPRTPQRRCGRRLPRQIARSQEAIPHSDASRISAAKRRRASRRRLRRSPSSGFKLTPEHSSNTEFRPIPAPHARRRRSTRRSGLPGESAARHRRSRARRSTGRSSVDVWDPSTTPSRPRPRPTTRDRAVDEAARWDGHLDKIRRARRLAAATLETRRRRPAEQGAGDARSTPRSRVDHTLQRKAAPAEQPSQATYESSRAHRRSIALLGADRSAIAIAVCDHPLRSSASWRSCSTASACCATTAPRGCAPRWRAWPRAT